MTSPVPIRPVTRPSGAQRPTRTALLAGAVAVVAWAVLSPSASTRVTIGGDGGVVILAVFLVTFTALSLDLADRTLAVIAGGLACVTLGTLLGFYSPPAAASYLWDHRTPLGLLAGVSMITGLLEESGWFDRLALRALARSRGQLARVFSWFCLLTFLFSMFVNNLAAIMVVAPLTIQVARPLRVDPVPLLIGEVIASNLGGAATMIGDFPNMLIASQADLGFTDFLLHLAPICALELMILVWCLARGSSPLAMADPQSIVREVRVRPWRGASVRRGLACLAGMLLTMPLASRLGLTPALPALIAGHLALIAGGVAWREVIRHVSLDDLVFFAALFVMVGAVDSSDVLAGPTAAVAALWARNPVWGILALTWGAAFLTCFLNAGPTTALLLPVGVALSRAGAGHTVWWAISLGVCAGSSATLTGATAGPVAAHLLERDGHRLSFNRFAATGVPMMFLFLALSSAYLAALVY